MAAPVNQSAYQFDEDTPHTSGDRGTAALVVRKDTAASLAGTDGDYTLLEVDANGKLYVNTGAITIDEPVSVDDNGGSLTVDGTVAVTHTALSNIVGIWSYYAGTSGTVNITAGQRVLGIAAYSLLGGTVTIDGGATITIPAGGSFEVEPLGNLVAPSIVFTGTTSYFIQVVA